MAKTVYFESVGRIHPTQLEIIDYPPNGFSFINTNRLPRTLSQDIVYYRSRRIFERVLPLNLVGGCLTEIFDGMHHSDLIYSYNHPVFARRPWVVFVEWVHVLVGRDIRHFSKWRPIVQRQLASENCKGIITWSQLAKQSILLNLNCSGFLHKIRVLPLSVHRKNFSKLYDANRVRLLFVGSPSMREDFYHKGGLDVLRAFRDIVQSHPNVELTMRANVPREVQQSYQNIPNLKIIDQVLSRDDLDELYRSADIFVQPTHDTPFGAFLEAMSYELPVITRDAFVNSELVEDGVTGLIVQGSFNTRYFTDFGKLRLIPLGATPKRDEFLAAIHRYDPVFVDRLKRAIVTLVENPQLRKKIGRRGRFEVEEGRFSIARRNEILQEVFRDAI